MKKSDKEYIEEVLNEYILLGKKPTSSQIKRASVALEKLKRTQDGMQFIKSICELLIALFT